MLKKSYPKWYHPAVSVLGRLRLETHSLMESLAYRERDLVSKQIRKIGEKKLQINPQTITKEMLKERNNACSLRLGLQRML